MNYTAALLALLFAAEPVEIARTATFTEGPVFDGRGTLFFSHREGISQLTPDGKQSEWVRDGEAGFHGHKILPDGTHLVCASKKGAIYRFDASGKLLGIASAQSEGKPLRAPNDLTLDDRGGFYFTDPGGSREAPVGTVHYTDSRGVTLTCIGGLRVPNGIVTDPRGEFLYVAETVPNRILRFPVLAPGKLGAMSIFAVLPSRPGHEAAPDGLAVDTGGNLYVAHLGTRSVIVLNNRGKILRSLHAGNYDASNLAFGGAGRNQLFITGSIGHRTNTEGRVFRIHLRGVEGRP